MDCLGTSFYEEVTRFTLCQCGCRREPTGKRGYWSGKRGIFIQYHDPEKPNPLKGRTKETHESVARQASKISGENNPTKRLDVRRVLSKKASGDKNPNKREEVRRKHSERMSGDGNPAKRSDVKEKLSLRMRGDCNPSKDPEVRIFLSERMRSEQNPNTRPEIRLKQAEAKKGERNPHWKGGGLGNYYPSEFLGVRLKILKEDDYTCQVCYSLATNVHHISGDREDNHRANLVSLCRSCHMKSHGTRREKEKWRQFFEELLRFRFQHAKWWTAGPGR